MFFSGVRFAFDDLVSILVKADPPRDADNPGIYVIICPNFYCNLIILSIVPDASDGRVV